MCGIVAFTGARQAQPILLNALSRLEYRGYDSSGIAFQENGSLRIVKKAGRIAKLEQACLALPSPSFAGICHTRWATHGEANDTNAHPHTDASGRLAIVHNGVIENYQRIKEKLIQEGHQFSSQTDTEVLAHLIGKFFDQSKQEGKYRLVDAVKQAVKEAEGTFGLAVMHADLPDVLVGTRRGSPLVLGLGEGENFLSSDANALLGYTQKVIYIKDHDVVLLTPEDFEITVVESMERAAFEIHEIQQTSQDAELGNFEHYMLKEIFEQPISIANALRGRLDYEGCTAKLGGLNLSDQQLREVKRIVVLACGTALHAGKVGEYMLESLAQLPVEVDYASEFRYRTSPIDPHTLFFVVSQSGETADTLGALREVQRRGFRCLGICNNVASSVGRETDGGVYMHAGPEVGVAATKSFTSQVAIFALLGLLFGRLRSVSSAEGKEIIEALESLPKQIQKILDQADAIKKVAQKFAHSHSMLFLGRQANFPVALEGALKLKEISYIHAEGYPSAELKHGVLALIDEQTPSVFIIPHDGLYDKNMSNLQEIKARKGPVIAVATEDDERIHRVADSVLYVPSTIDYLQPILNTIPLQLLSYYISVELGRDVDKPRNLAKSVTVE